MDIEKTASALAGVVGENNLIKDAHMKDYTTFKAGGNADFLVMPADFHQLGEILKMVAKEKTPYYIMGEGSNTLVKDEGYKGIIIKIGDALSKIEVNGEVITAESGALIKNVSKAAVNAGLTGLEFAIGIPGSVGGTSFMNAGAYGGEMSGVVEYVEIMKPDGSEIYTLKCHELDYGYRKSRIMNEGGIVLKTVFKLKKANPDQIKATIDDFQERRRQKQPLGYPSAGSFFKRPPGNFAGTLIEKAGLKGTRVGGAMVSTLHAGFIVNTGGATADDIIALMELVKEKVFEMSGIELEPEVRIIGS